ncbi:MAG: ATP synthase F0 subunit B [Acidobacteriota bacterium]|nr:ATP synthase F0 subunit B [Vicinamibacterales bacterium]MEE2610401.1 ATP synthase F0 subunit B [Acidobacteriota bacterium]MEE3138692.1 ATP synthase F0 subunit B [Acidobacteriota bacterium]
MIPDLTVIWVIGLVLLLSWTLKRLLIAPLTEVMETRERAIRSAVELAESAAKKAAEATTEFEIKTAAARAEIYQQMDENRRELLARRAEILDETQRDAESNLADATERLKTQTAEARAQLERDAEALGLAAAEQVLGRKISSN